MQTFQPDFGDLNNDLDSVRHLLFGPPADQASFNRSNAILTHFEEDTDEDENETIEEDSFSIRQHSGTVRFQEQPMPSEMDFRTEVLWRAERELASGTAPAEVSRFLLNLGLRIQASYLPEEQNSVN